MIGSHSVKRSINQLPFELAITLYVIPLVRISTLYLCIRSFSFSRSVYFIFNVMALIRTTIATDDDEFQEDLKYYKDRIVLANEMKKMMGTRLYLLKAGNSKPSYAALMKDTPHNIQVTKLELGLMEAVDTFHKVVMDRQLLHIALQKCVQSTMLYVSPKNLWSASRRNYIERCVAEQMKSMLTNSNTMCSLKQSNDEQVCAILDYEERLMGRVAYQQDKVKQTGDTNMSDDEVTQMNTIRKKIDGINKMSTFITTLVSIHCKSLDYESGRKLIVEASKWRTPRTLTYYKNLCRHSM